MGYGKKMQTNTSKEKSSHRPTANGSLSARNLSKNELGGVIFGCKDHTIKECLSNLLFGLPESHFSYIKNIHPGMPLFLFNYSDRKLRGIYEAASHGTMNINPYGWTKNGSALTEYPAQVRVRVTKDCQMLSEEQFKNILRKNYLKDTKHHFWFELDHTQTGQLISLFEASPLNSTFTYNSPTRIRTAPTLDTRQVNGYLMASATGEGCSKYAATVSTQKGASLFKENSDYGRQTEKGDLSSVPEVNWDEGHVFFSDNDSAPASFTTCWEGVTRKTARWGDEETEPSDVADCWEDHIEPLDVTPFGDEGAGPSTSNCWEEEAGTSGVSLLEDGNQTAEIQLEKKTIEDEEERIYRKPKLLALEAGPSTSTCWEEEAGTSGVTLLEDGNQTADIQLEKKVIEDEEERIYRKLKLLALERESLNTKDASFTACRVSSSHIKDGCSSAADSVSNEENSNSKEDTKDAVVSLNPCLEDKNPSSTDSTSKNHEDVSTNSPDIQSEISQVRQDLEEVKALSIDNQKRNNESEKKLADAYILIQHLRQRVTSLETHLQDSSPANVESEHLMELFDERQLGVGDLIFIMGGLDGLSWLSTLDCYSPLRDSMKFVKPMSSIRSHATAVALNGLIYNIGGWNYYSKLWYDTVECYNPMNNEWISCPSLSEKKGCLAGAVVNNKIFAVGGGNGMDSFNQVEMFDPMLGRWIPMQSMLHKRFATAAAEIDGVLYVAGGFDGKNYLSSVERYDPREASWCKLQSMKTRRGCHALTNFNGKLYALSGYDGSNYNPSVEVFDPLMGRWFEEGKMKFARGNFYAPVLGDSILAIGGLAKDNIVDEIETYRFGHGWSVTGSRGFGKRCYFSAVLY